MSISSYGQISLDKNGSVIRLMRDGNPFVMLAGELHNSSSSTAATFRSSLATAKAMGMNSVIASVSWEQIEPEENVFDFAQIDDILRIAGEMDMPMALIWFGSYKNGESSYAPLWVKKDVRRFPRCQFKDGMNSTTLSPLGKETVNADAKAFSRLMGHIAEKDTRHLVCVMQIENEMGAFMDIDHSSTASKAYNGQVPSELLAYMKSNRDSLKDRIATLWKENGYRMKGTWKEVFGDNDYAKQYFMSWNFARFADQVAREGKKAYNIPMYVNCWMADEDKEFGTYPNGGPRLMAYDVYKAAAKSVDFLSPDVYSKDVREVFSAYAKKDNPLFIPEVSRIAGPAYYAFGQCQAICYSPFGFEESYNDDYMVGEYKTLGELMPLISEHQGDGSMRGFYREELDAEDDSVSLSYDKYSFNVHYIKGEKSSHGIVIRLSEDEFIVAGTGAYITFSSSKSDEITKVAFAEEVEFKEDQMSRIFVLNGDETGHHNMLYLRGRMPNPDYESKEADIKVPGPVFRPSYQRMHMPEWQSRYKVSGIYRIRLYTYPYTTK